MRRIPRAARGVEIDRERLVALRLFVIVGEIIDHLFDSDRVFRRKRTGVDEAPDVRVRSRVDIDRERRERIGRRRQERVFLYLVVSRRVEVLAITRWRLWLRSLTRSRTERVHRHRRGWGGSGLIQSQTLIFSSRGQIPTAAWLRVLESIHGWGRRGRGRLERLLRDFHFDGRLGNRLDRRWR